MRPEEQFDELVQEYAARGLRRRELFERAAALGVSGSIVARALASASPALARPASPTRGGVLREGYDRDVSKIDPVATSWWDATLFPVTHETLLTADPSGKFTPMIARSWSVSKDGKTWTFKLRSGLKFQSGAPLDAKAIKAAFNEIRTKGVNAGFWGPVASVIARNSTTLVIKLKHPYADLPYVLNSGYSAIYNKKTRDKLKAGYGSKGVDGSGPFTLKEFVPGSHATVARWKGYPGSIVPFFQNKGQPYLDGIQYQVLTEPATRAQEIEAGNVDALHGPAPQDVARLKGNKDLAVIEFPEWSMYQLGLNFKRTDLGFGDVRVRQALSHAVDRATIAKKIFFGQAVPTYTLVPSSFPWYVKSVEQTGAYDPEKAKSLLKAAGVANISFKAIIEQDKVEQAVAQAIQSMFSNIGVNMSLEVHGGDYFDVVGKDPDAYMIKNLWPYMFDASLLFAGSAYQPPSCCNWQHASIPALDKALADWQSAKNPTRLAAASRRAQTVAAEQLPFIPIVTPKNVWVHRKNVHGWVPTLPNLYPFYQDVWLSK